MSKLGKVKEALQRMLMQFNQLSTSLGLITWAGNEDYPVVGDEIMVIDEEGNEAKAENGEYVTDNGTVITVEDGKVSDVKVKENEPENEPEPQPEPENEPEPTPEPEPQEDPQNEPEPETEPETENEPDEKDEKIKNLESEVARLEQENGELKEKIKELEEKSAAFSASEEFDRVNKIEKPTDKKLARLYDIVNAK